MSKISELSDGGSIQSGDTLIAVRSGGNVKVTYGGTTTANIDGGTIDGTVIGGSSAAAGTFTSITGTSANINGTVTADGLTVDGGSSEIKFSETASSNASLVLQDATERLSKIQLDITSPNVSTDYYAQGKSGGWYGRHRFYTSANNTTAVNRMEIGSNGDISFYDSAGSSQSFYWDASAESLGIGTTSPSAKLDVSGGDAIINNLTVGRGSGGVSTNTAVGASALRDNTTGISNTAVGYAPLTENTTGSYHTAVGYAALYKNTTGNYNVGYGMYAGYTNETGSSNTSVGYYTGYSNTGSYNTFIGQGAGNACTTGSNNTIIGVNAGSAGLSDTIILSAGATERMRIDSSGNVGIGTTSPSYLVDAQSSGDAAIRIRSTGTGASDDSLLRMQIAGTTASNIIAFGDSGSSFSGEIRYTHNNNSMSFDTNDSEAMRIDSSGNVGIGTTSPAAKLEIGGAGEGIILASPDGTRYKITVANGGILIVTAV